MLFAFFKTIDAFSSCAITQIINLAILVFAKCEHWNSLVDHLLIADSFTGGRIVGQRPNTTANIVGVNVLAFELRNAVRILYATASDRLASRVIIFPNRIDWSRNANYIWTISKRMSPFAIAPSVVATLGNDIHFFE